MIFNPLEALRSPKKEMPRRSLSLNILNTCIVPASDSRPVQVRGNYFYRKNQRSAKKGGFLTIAKSGESSVADQYSLTESRASGALSFIFLSAFCEGALH